MARAKNIGLIGVGLLGQAIAERLLQQGLRVVCFDIRDDLESLTKQNGVACKSPDEVAEQAQTLILCLPASSVVRTVVNELKPKLDKHTIIDTTTGSPADTVDIGEQLSEIGVNYLDSTVAGSSQQMRDGNAVLLVGGSESAFAACKPVFDALSSNSNHLGPIGSGARMKLVVNLAIGLNRAVLAEALAYGEAFGFDSHQVVDVLRNTPAHSAQMDTKGPKMADRDFTPQARLRQHHKDVKLILESAKQLGANVPLSQLHETLLQQLIDDGFGDKDNSAIINAFRSGSC